MPPRIASPGDAPASHPPVSGNFSARLAWLRGMKGSRTSEHLSPATLRPPTRSISSTTRTTPSPFFSFLPPPISTRSAPSACCTAFPESFLECADNLNLTDRCSDHSFAVPSLTPDLVLPASQLRRTLICHPHSSSRSRSESRLTVLRVLYRRARRGLVLFPPTHLRDPRLTVVSTSSWAPHCPPWSDGPW